MFERFTESARGAVVEAQVEARSLGHGWIGSEHLLLAVLADAETPLARALASLGLTHDAARAQVATDLAAGIDDGTALRELGIDLDAVRRRVEDRFGPGALDQGPPPSRRRWRRRRRAAEPRRERSGGGHIPFDAGAKKSLELALREALAQHSKEIRAEHLVLGLMRTEGLATRVVTALGARPDVVRRAVLELGRAA